MSPVRRSISSSSAIMVSRRLRSRMIGLEAAGSFQRAGSASVASMSASSLRMRAGSKILPQVARLVAHGSIGEFEIVQRHALLLRPGLTLNFEVKRWPQGQANNPQTQYGTDPPKNVAVRGIEGHIVAETVFGGQCVR